MNPCGKVVSLLRSCYFSTMRVLDGPVPYDMPIAWYFAPNGAKLLDSPCAFGSQNWDKSPLDRPYAIGETADLPKPYYNGKNIWGYLGQCQIGTALQFAEGLTQAELDAPLKPIPACCDGQYIPPAQFGPFCGLVPEDVPDKFQLIVHAPDPATFPYPELLTPVVVSLFEECGYKVELPDTVNYQNAEWLFLINSTTTAGGFTARSPTNSLQVTSGFINDFPLGLYPGVFIRGDVAAALATCLFEFQTWFPSNPMITLSGDVFGSGVSSIVCSLIHIGTAGTVGDASHVPVLTIDVKGRVTGYSQVAIAGGVAIGDAIAGATPNEILFVDAGGLLAQSGALSYDGSTFSVSGVPVVISVSAGDALTINQGSTHAVLCDGSTAASFRDATHTVTICDGTNNVLYTWGGGSPAWGGTPPTDVWVALDRLAAWMAANFPALPLP